MTQRKRLFIFLIITMIVILVYVIEFILTNKHNTSESRIIIDNTELVDSIANLDKVIDSLKHKLEYDEVKIKALDDSSSIELFYKLVQGE